MSRIDMHNYEAYLLDFSEGNLGSEMQIELELFLIQHPELNVDLGELQFVELGKEEVSFPQKNNLKKSEFALVSETQFISYIENQIPLNERLLIEKSCVLNPLLSDELSLYQQTIILADTSIIYPNKNELKRRAGIIWFDFSVSQYAAAACVLFLIGLFILWPKPTTTSFNRELAQQKTIPSVIKENRIFNEKNQAGAERKNTEQITIAQNSKQPKIINTVNQSTAVKVSVFKDTILEVPNKPSNIEELNKKEVLIAKNNLPEITHSNQTVVQVIIEN